MTRTGTPEIFRTRVSIFPSKRLCGDESGSVRRLTAQQLLTACRRRCSHDFPHQLKVRTACSQLKTLDLNSWRSDHQLIFLLPGQLRETPRSKAFLFWKHHHHHQLVRSKQQRNFRLQCVSLTHKSNCNQCDIKTVSVWWSELNKVLWSRTHPGLVSLIYNSISQQPPWIHGIQLQSLNGWCFMAALKMQLTL